MNLNKEIQEIEEAEKGCEVKEALAGALEKVEREINKQNNIQKNPCFCVAIQGLAIIILAISFILHTLR